VTTEPRLDEYDKTEMRDISRALRPDITDAEFDADWEEFCRLKAMKGMQ
jgi:hypothetical protein